ncbi:hypothetical protein [Acidovorax sp.]|uniref:hypothetical protein n=1 Tax=Acidovorax sp. TaxID=1872122 RepID=UPI0025BE1A4E|nr:hypothetical protein [Acidovorax sp.]
MSARDQVFTGTVTGDVAGRDVVKNIHLPHERPESELQAVFKQHTGIDCSREVRQHLEDLMAHHGFTGQDLARAWNVGSLVWDSNGKTLRPGARRIDYAAGWVGVIALTAALVVSLAETMLNAPGPFVKPALLLVICLAYITMTRLVLLATIFPQATARRVEKVLQEISQ